MTSRKANMDFTNFDQRQYPTVTPKVGYAEWANTYEASVPGLLDIGILERIHSIRWPETRQCLDLACGTGRTGRWLAAKGVSQIDGGRSIGACKKPRSKIRDFRVPRTISSS